MWMTFFLPHEKVSLADHSFDHVLSQELVYTAESLWFASSHSVLSPMPAASLVPSMLEELSAPAIISLIFIPHHTRSKPVLSNYI